MERARIAALTMTVCAALAGGASAAGYQFSPPNSTVTGSGTATVSLNSNNVTCNVTTSGSTSQPSQITSVSFSGGTGCDTLIANNLPWKFTPHTAGRATLNHVTISWMKVGRCGPNQVKVNVANGQATIMDHLPSQNGVCSLDATLTMTPAISIVPAS